ncbi:DNA-binding transcriptional repressor DeoR, partial [Yersinia enterocolitica]|nr:DNA-binding transcriptional repressor DeoR [Yersinia enterocolitica]
HKILVADHSKFGKIKPASIGALTLFDAIVTNCQPDSEFNQFFLQHNIKTYC